MLSERDFNKLMDKLTTRTVTIPLDEYEELLKKISDLNNEVSDLDYKNQWNLNLLKHFGVSSLYSRKIIPDTIHYETMYDPRIFRTKYRITFEVEGLVDE